MTHLTFHDSPQLVESAYEALFDAIPMIEVCESKAYYNRYERVIKEGFTKNMKMNRGGKMQILKVVYYSYTFF